MGKMRTFKLDKLVRDGIVPGHEQEGGSCDWEVLGGDELKRALKMKLKEEMDELLNSPNNVANEYADVQEVLDRLAELDGFNKKDIAQSAEKKSSKVGAFTKGIYVKTVTVPVESWLAKYYSSKPERFPEILDD